MKGTAQSPGDIFYLGTEGHGDVSIVESGTKRLDNIAKGAEGSTSNASFKKFKERIKEVEKDIDVAEK